MISFYIQKGINTNKVLFDSEQKDDKNGLMIRVTNKDFLHKYYFIDSDELYTSVLFNKNKPKVVLKALLENIGLKVIPDSYKNNGYPLSSGLIDINLTKWDNYRGLFK